MDWYSIKDIETLDTPALVVFPDRVKHNINLAVNIVGDVSRLRPHVKTYKNKEVTLLMMEAGIDKFKCATIAEAEMLAICGASDVLLAYQPIGPKLVRFIKLIAAYPNTVFSCLVDNSAAAMEIAELAIINNIQVPVYVDLNIGQNRTGISAGSEALKLYIDCSALPGIKPIGLHAYDGHIHDADLDVRFKKCNLGFEPVIELQSNLIALGYLKPTIIAGGSPTFPIHAKREDVECSPGTFVYWDRGYQTMLNEQPFLPAVVIIARIISLPDETKICLDLGHKSISAENDIGKRVYFLNAPELKFLNQSEEHLVAEVRIDHPYKVGDVLYGLPYHVCPTVALYERIITIENNKTNGEWKNIARDRKITI